MKADTQIDYITQNEKNSKQREESGLATPKISIIVPVYNVEQYLRCCLDSIVAQTLTDWECILIDDGSPDNSGAICDEYAIKDNRFKVIHQKNRGVAAVRNTGLQQASGEWISWIDSDDWVESIFLEALYNKVLEENADVVSCDIIEVTKKGKFIVEQNIAVNHFDLMDKLLCLKIYGSIWHYLIRKELFRNISFVKGLNFGEDILVSIKLFAEKPRTAHLPNALYHYRATNVDSITRSHFSFEKCKQLVKSMELIEQVFKQKNIYHDHIATILERRKYVKFRILYASSLFTGISFYGLYPNLSKHIKIHSASDLFNKVLLFNTEIKNIPVVWFCIGFYKIFWGIKNRIIKR